MSMPPVTLRIAPTTYDESVSVARNTAGGPYSFGWAGRAMGVMSVPKVLVCKSRSFQLQVSECSHKSMHMYSHISMNKRCPKQVYALSTGTGML